MALMLYYLLFFFFYSVVASWKTSCMLFLWLVHFGVSTSGYSKEIRAGCEATA